VFDLVDDLLLLRHLVDVLLFEGELLLEKRRVLGRAAVLLAIAVGHRDARDDVGAVAGAAVGQAAAVEGAVGGRGGWGHGGRRGARGRRHAALARRLVLAVADGDDRHGRRRRVHDGDRVLTPVRVRRHGNLTQVIRIQFPQVLLTVAQIREKLSKLIRIFPLEDFSKKEL